MVIFILYIVFVTLEKKIESHQKLCENKDFCNVIMPSEENKIL